MRTRSAFTLIELLIAIAMLLVLLGAVFAFTDHTASSRDRLLAAATRQLTADVLIEQLEQALITAVASTHEHPSGVVGTSDSFTIRSLASSTGGRADSQRTLVLNGSEWGVALRRQGSGGVTEGVLDGIRRVELAYRVDRRWADSFDSGTAGRLPSAVRIAIWFGDPPADPSLGAGFDPAGVADGLQTEPDDGFEEAERVVSPPDRVRVIPIPDAGEEDA